MSSWIKEVVIDKWVNIQLDIQANANSKHTYTHTGSHTQCEWDDLWAGARFGTETDAICSVEKSIVDETDAAKLN